MIGKQCKKGLTVEVLKSSTGFYIGTKVYGLPNCRLTTQYAKTEEEAKTLSCDRQSAMENHFCNCTGSCFR